MKDIKIGKCYQQEELCYFSPSLLQIRPLSGGKENKGCTFFQKGLSREGFFCFNMDWCISLCKEAKQLTNTP